MHELLPAWPLLSVFLLASLVLAITPGPGVFYIVTRSILQGRSAGLASVAGVALGNLGNAIGASIGLAALFAVSSFAFMLVKYAGAAYLVYLGIQALRMPAANATSESMAPIEPRKIFRDGFLVALLNPKTAVFFAAFLPQFMQAEASSAVRSAALGAIFVAIAAATDSIYALTAGAVAPILARASHARKFGRYLSSVAFIGLGVFTAFSGSRSEG